ncbi:hypothetical protein [Nonomuraea sp. NPDC003709]|uniref:hypothetical protein n=1 Tax=Nonomuraea sp. NPDC003709 TaxID=3154450 RepID=UPI0033B7C16B
MTADYDAWDGTDPLTALLDASRHYAIHVRLLIDQLAEARLGADDVGRVEDAMCEVAEAAALAVAVTMGLRRHVRREVCPHYNLLTDAEWAPARDGALARGRAYGCELQPGHPGLHTAQFQESPVTRRGEWLRWGRAAGGEAVRELVDLPYCSALWRGADPRGLDDETCGLPAEHVGAHAVNNWLGEIPPGENAVTSQ